MRIAHILRKYDPAEWGGTETAIHQLTHGLLAHGVRSVTYAPRLPNSEATTDPFAEGGCEMRRFRAYMPIWGISSERRRQMVAVGGNLLSFQLMRLLCRERDVDVIHSHVLGRLGATGLAVARRRRIPFVFTIHGGIYDIPASVRNEFTKSGSRGVDWGKPFGMLLRSRHLLTRADLVLCCNPREAEMLRERHPNLPVMVKPHGVRAGLFAWDHRQAARDAFPQLNGKNILLALGRLDPVKNQAWLVEQAHELVRRHPKAVLCLVGPCTDKKYGEELKAKIKAAGLGKSVVILGRLPSEDPRLIGLLQDADAVVLPSFAETFGLAIIEAWAAGTPVIASRTSGASAMVEEGKNGFLFSLDKPSEFHAAIDRIIGHPDTRREFGEAGRTRVNADYDSDVLAEKMTQIYRGLIEAKRCVT